MDTLKELGRYYLKCFGWRYWEHLALVATHIRTEVVKEEKQQVEHYGNFTILKEHFASVESLTAVKNKLT